MASATRSSCSGTCWASRSRVSASTRPIVRPWGTCLTPPMAWPSECSAVQSEMFIVRPAIMLPQAMSERAAASVPSWVAFDQRAGHHADRLKRDGVADRGADLGDHAGDGLGQRVDAGVGGHRRGHRVRQPRVDQRVLRAQGRVGDAGLGVVREVGDHGAAGDLRARACAGREGDQRSGSASGRSGRTRGTRGSPRRAQRTGVRPSRCRSPIRRRSRRRLRPPMRRARRWRRRPSRCSARRRACRRMSSRVPRRS